MKFIDIYTYNDHGSRSLFFNRDQLNYNGEYGMNE